MNNHIIYLENDEIKSKSMLSKQDFDLFVGTLSVESILFKDGVTTIDNLTESQKETFNIFLKSMKKNWDLNQLVVQPKPISYEVKLDGINLTITDKTPKKRGRKKKEQK